MSRSGTNIEDNNLPRVHSLLLDIKDSSNGLKIILAGFISNFIVFGVNFSFGVFQDYYTSSSGPLRQYSDSEVAIIGTTASALTYIGGIFNKTLLFYFSPRTVMLSGGILMGLGIIIAVFCSSMYQFILTQGVMFGVGSSMLYMPPVVCAPMFFNRNRAIAMGFLFSGSGFGGLGVATVSRFLISKMGWRWCLRIEGILILTCAITASLLVKIPKTVSEQFQFNSRKILTFSQLKSWKVWLQLLGSLLQSAHWFTCQNMVKH